MALVEKFEVTIHYMGDTRRDRARDINSEQEALSRIEYWLKQNRNQGAVIGSIAKYYELSEDDHQR